MSRWPGWYYDGETSERQDAMVELGPNGLILRDAAGRSIADWPYEELKHQDLEWKGGAVRLMHGNSLERLTLSDEAVLQSLLDFAPQLKPRSGGLLRLSLKVAGFSVVSLVALFVFLRVLLPGAADVVAHQVPIEWEEALGDTVAEQFLEILSADGNRLAVCDDAEGVAVLEGLVRRLATAGGTAYDFKVTVVDHAQANAFAVPGGGVFLFKGLIDQAESAEEVAGVIAHEMGHVTQRHGTEALAKALGLSFLFGVMMGDLGTSGVAISVETLTTTAYSRDAEREADAAAARLLADAGISGKGLLRFMERAKKGEIESTWIWLVASHPNSGERLRALEGMVEDGGPALSDEDWQSLKGICSAPGG